MRTTDETLKRLASIDWENMLATDIPLRVREWIPGLMADIAELKAERDAAIESDRINRHLVARLTDERTQAIIDKEHMEKNLDALVERHANLRAASRSLQDRWEETKTERDALAAALVKIAADESSLDECVETAANALAGEEKP